MTSLLCVYWRTWAIRDTFKITCLIIFTDRNVCYVTTVCVPRMLCFMPIPTTVLWSCITYIYLYWSQQIVKVDTERCDPMYLMYIEIKLLKILEMNLYDVTMTSLLRVYWRTWAIRDTFKITCLIIFTDRNVCYVSTVCVPRMLCFMPIPTTALWCGITYIYLYWSQQFVKVDAEHWTILCTWCLLKSSYWKDWRWICIFTKPK